MSKRTLLAAVLASATWVAASWGPVSGAGATTVPVCMGPDRDARFVVPAGRTDAFRAAVRAFGAEAGYVAAEDRGVDASYLSLTRRDFTNGVMVTILDGKREVFAGFVDDTACDRPLPPSSRAAWDRFLSFMARRGWRGEPHSFQPSSGRGGSSQR